MKFLASLLVSLLALSSTMLAESPINPDFGDGHFKKTFPPATKKPWSIADTWLVTHTVWHGSLIFKPDGLIYNPNGALEGQWILTTQEGEVHLIIRWNKWTADNLTMINGNEFYGCDGRSEIWLRRVLPMTSVTELPAANVPEIRSWRQGEPPVKLIRKEEGFCALTSIVGHFEGYGESVKVYVAEDGYWYLGGSSQQNDVAAQCIVVRYASRDDHRAAEADRSPSENARKE